MWKLVKTELSYLKPAIVGSIALFVVLAITLIISLKFPRHGFAGPDPDAFIRSGVAIIISIILFHQLLNLALVYLEIRENHLRSIAVLPVPRGKIGAARIVTPAVLLVIFLLLAASVTLLLIWNLPRSVHFYRSGWNLALFSPWTTNIHYSWNLALGIGLWSITVYAIRLASEYYGRLLLVAYIVTMVFLRIEQSIGNSWLLRKITLFLYQGQYPSLTGFGLMVLTLLLCLVIHGSYLRRRSFAAL